jgi:hypothetical protein
MDRAFSRSKRKISSLAYCANAVAEIAEERKDLESEKPAPPEFSENEVQTYLRGLAGKIRGLADRFGEFRDRLDRIASSVEALDASDLRAGENALNALEEKLIAIISVAASEATLIEARESVQKELGPFRSRMTADQISMLDQQLWKRKLMELHRVPRLSLFYLI